MSNARKKSWGWSMRVLFVPDQIQVEHIFAKPGGYSSIHDHKYKTNQFIVISGRLTVHRFTGENATAIEESAILGPGDIETVKPLIRHQFVASTEVDAYEVYWLANDGILDPDDIVRYSTGGLDGEWANGPNSSQARFRHCCRCNLACLANELTAIVIDNAIRDICGSCLKTKSQ